MTFTTVLTAWHTQSYLQFSMRKYSSLPGGKLFSYANLDASSYVFQLNCKYFVQIYGDAYFVSTVDLFES